MKTNQTIAAGDAPWPDIIAWVNHWLDRLGEDVDGLTGDWREQATHWLVIFNRARKADDGDLMAFAVANIQSIVNREKDGGK